MRYLTGLERAERDAKIVEQRRQGLGPKDIAKIWDITPARVSQILLAQRQREKAA